MNKILHLDVFFLCLDEKWFKIKLARILETNFCYPNETELEEISEGFYKQTDYVQVDNEDFYNASNLGNVEKSLKKVVTFKVGLTLDRNFQPYKGALISKEEVKFKSSFLIKQFN